MFEEAKANKAAGKYDNASIDYQVEFYKREGLIPYTEAKLPITSGKCTLFSVVFWIFPVSSSQIEFCVLCMGFVRCS